MKVSTLPTTLLLLSLAGPVTGFTLKKPLHNYCGVQSMCLASSSHHHNEKDQNSLTSSPSSLSDPKLVTRQDILHSLSSAAVGVAVTSIPFTSAWAEDNETSTTKKQRSITPCQKKSGTTNCISTANVKQLDLYAPPWTFETSPEEAAARLKGVIASDSSLQQIEDTDTDDFFIRVQASRNGGVFKDQIEFSINPVDKVITFRCEQEGEPSISDFGAIRKQMDSIRQRASIFTVQGQGYAADTLPSQNGPLGQLKAFYGLQSGKGFEDVYED